MLQAAFAQLLCSLTGQHDVAFGAVVSGTAGRGGRRGIDGGAVDQHGAGAGEHHPGNHHRRPARSSCKAPTTTPSSISIWRCSDIHRITGHDQLFDTVFVYENYPTDTAALLGGAHELVITDFRDFYHYPLTVQAVPGRELELRVQYRADLFDRATIEALIERMKRVLVAMTADPNRRLSKMDLLTDGEHVRLDRSANRAALPQQPVTKAVSPSEHHDTAGDYRAPDDLVEQILVGIYAQVLGVDRVSVDESFFDLGGDSLSAMRAIAAINTALDINFAVTTLFEAPSVRGLRQQLGSMPARWKKFPSST